jgi:ribosomal protein L21E
MGVEKGQLVTVIESFIDSSSGKRVSAGSTGRVWKIEGDNISIEVEVDDWFSKKTIIAKTDRWNIS